MVRLPQAMDETTLSDAEVTALLDAL